MSGPGRRRRSRAERERSTAADAALTSALGTPLAVDVGHDRAARRTWLLLLGGPAGWFVHFAVVYLVAEAGCTGSGPGLSRLGPPVPRLVIVVATVVACLWCAACAWLAYSAIRRLSPPPGGETPAEERQEASPGPAEDSWAWASWDPTALLAQVGLLLAGLSALAILFVGVSTPWLPGCR